MTEREPIIAADELGDATDALVAAFGDVLDADVATRGVMVGAFRRALGAWQETLINRCSAQSSGFVPLLNRKIERLAVRVCELEPCGEGDACARSDE